MRLHPKHIGLILWGINLSSIAASIFSYVYLSYFMYLKTGSVLYSEFILLAPMFITVLLYAVIHHITQLVQARLLLLWSNLSGLFLACLCFSFLPKYLIFSVVASLGLGFLDAIQRVARMVAIKRYFSSQDIQYVLPLTLTAQFIAGGIAGVGLAFYQATITPSIALMIVSSLFVIAVICTLILPNISAVEGDGSSNLKIDGRHDPQGAFKKIHQILKTYPDLRYYFWHYIIFVSIFQGFFNVSRVTLPSHQLSLSQNFVGYVQIISAMSALCGALLFAYLSKRRIGFQASTVFILSSLSLCAMIFSASVPHVAFSFSMYFVYMFVWELLFFKHQADVMAATPQEHMPSVATFQYATVYLGMMIMALFGGLLVHYFDLGIAAFIFAMIYVTVMMVYRHPTRDMAILSRH